MKRSSSKGLVSLLSGRIHRGSSDGVETRVSRPRRTRGWIVGALVATSSGSAILVTNVSGCDKEERSEPAERVGEAAEFVTEADCKDLAGKLTLPNPDDAGASGWTSTGPALIGGATPPQLVSDDQNTGVAQGTAQLFTQTIGNVLCTYLLRRVGGATANGVLCFDTTDCSICAWDLDTTGGAKPAGTPLKDMLNPTSYGASGGIQDCSACHVNGPMMPTEALYDQINLIDLMNTCVKNGGPTWLGAPGTWAQPQLGNRIAIAACGGAGCHGNDKGENMFLKTQSAKQKAAYCGKAAQAFGPGGSMQSSYCTECAVFMPQIGCDASLCPSCPDGGASTDSGPPPCRSSDWMWVNHGFIFGTPSGHQGDFALAAGIVDGVTQGSFTYDDPAAPERVVSLDVTSYTVVSPTTRRIQGDATVNGVSGFTYTIDATDNGLSDFFSLTVSNGYAASGALSTVQLSIHVCP